MKRLSMTGALLSSLLCTSATQAALTDGLVGLYQFENNFSDTSASAGLNNGTPINNPGFTTGKVGQAMNLTGFQDYMSLDPALFPELDFGTTDLPLQDAVDFSVSMWVRQDDFVSDPAVFSNKDWANGNNTGINWAVKGSGIFDLNTKGDTGFRRDLDTAQNSWITTVGDWNLIVMTVDRDGTTELYINGANRGSVPVSSLGNFNSGLPWNVGQDGTGTYGLEFTGAVDELSIWRRALDPAETDQLWNGGAGFDISSLVVENTLKLIIDRDTGRMTIENGTPADQDIKAYSIVSQAGTLNQSNWQTITGRLDASGDQSVDADGNWVVLTDPASVADLSEAALGTGTIGVGSSIDLGVGTWSRYFQEGQDITFQYADAVSSEPIQGVVRFVGNGDAAFQFADLDFDGDLDADDWTRLENAFGSDLAGLSEAQRYRASDLNNDGVHTLDDILQFRLAFDQANGAGAFATLIQAVPEPGAAILAATLLLAMGLMFGRQRYLRVAAVPTVCLLGLVMVGESQAGVVFSENFDSLVLGPNVDEAVAEPNAFTHTPPAGWNIVNNLPGEGSGDGVGVTEWEGWSFADRDWWAVAAEDQQRTLFTNASGTVAVADPDEWDDLGNPAPESLGTYNTFLSTGPISVTGLGAGVLKLGFDSSWRDEDNQKVNVTVSYDGGTPIEVLRWTSTAGPDFHDDAPNEAVEIGLNNPAGANSAVITFGMQDAGNDWWWAIDNVVVFTPVILEVDVQSGVMTLQGDAGLALTGYEVSSTSGSLNATGWLQGNLDALGVGNATQPAADLSNNGTVDQADLGILEGAFGAGAAGDTNADGETNGQDFLIWQRGFGDDSAPGSTWQTFLATDEQLIEAYLLGSSTFASDQSIGSGYNTAIDARDLVFTYTTESGESKVGVVQYVNTASPVTAIPEPSTLCLLAMTCLVLVRRIHELSHMS